MGKTPNERFIATHVLIRFDDGSVFFCVPPGATVAAISENLQRIGDWHKGQPISIDVRFKAQKNSGCDGASPFP
jgi:hypothetical protein